MRWTLRYHRDATKGSYRVERGKAAIVTEAIGNLTNNPRPPGSEPIPERPGLYTIEAAGTVIGYEILESERAVLILWIG